jgi:spore coat polysaccharide biosynthesis predicted glycosyltransferase SpsG
MGLPTVGIITAENQKPLASVLYEAGAIDLIGESAEATKAGIEAAITSLLNNPHVRQTMSAAASELCDGGGIYRLSAVLDGTKIRQDLHDW